MKGVTRNTAILFPFNGMVFSLQEGKEVEEVLNCSSPKRTSQVVSFP
jgi:hypothetical protein